MRPSAPAALATETGRFAHLSEALAEATAGAGCPATVDLGQLRDPGTAVASATVLARAWAQTRGSPGPG